MLPTFFLEIWYLTVAYPSPPPPKKKTPNKYWTKLTSL